MTEVQRINEWESMFCKQKLILQPRERKNQEIS